jgi:hypothetical protein
VTDYTTRFFKKQDLLIGKGKRMSFYRPYLLVGATTVGPETSAIETCCYYNHFNTINGGVIHSNLLEQVTTTALLDNASNGSPIEINSSNMVCDIFDGEYSRGECKDL